MSLFQKFIMKNGMLNKMPHTYTTIEKLKNTLLFHKINKNENTFGNDNYSYFLKYVNEKKGLTFYFRYKFVDSLSDRDSFISLSLLVSKIENEKIIERSEILFNVDSKYKPLYNFHNKLFSSDLYHNKSVKIKDSSLYNSLELESQIKSF